MEDEQEKIKFKAVGKPDPNIGIDEKNSIINKLLADDNGFNKLIDIDNDIIIKFRTISNSREDIYQIFDEMSKDVLMNSALELYADDSTEYNEYNQIIWAESDKPEIAKYINHLIESLKLDESAWSHILALVQYGDIYLETFRKSDFEEEIKGKKNIENQLSSKSVTEDNELKQVITEDIILNVYNDNDKLNEYIELVANPAEIFDLTKRGKTVGFLKTKISNKQNKADSYIYNYNINSEDIKLYDPAKYIHILLPDTSNRNPEEIKIFRSNEKPSKKKSIDKINEALSFKVKRGKSILYNLFKIYREMKILEDTVLLNRITKSALVRIIQVEVGDMGKPQTSQLLQRIKSLFESKQALNEGQSLNEYNSPGPIENNVYIPTRDGKGGITVNTAGGDYNVGELTDLDFFLNKMFSGLKIPKPFLGFMDDNAGFSGGESLTKVSSRYAKTIKRIQNAYIQGIRTLINIFFLDRGLNDYINNFTIRMVSPSTIEDSDRLEMLGNKINLIADLMSTLSDVEDSSARLEIIINLLNRYISDEDLNTLLKEILEKQKKGTIESTSDNLTDKVETDLGTISSKEKSDQEELPLDLSSSTEEEEMLPNPNELDLDMSDNEQMTNELEGTEE